MQGGVGLQAENFSINCSLEITHIVTRLWKPFFVVLKSSLTPS